MPFSFKRSVTVQGSQVPGTLTNFPMLFSGTYTYLRTVANGGNVENANGHDIAFFSDSNLTTKLDHEVERWVASTGEYIAWVRIPTLTGTTDTVIWIAYGDVAITTSQQVPTGVWNSNFFVVLHTRDGTVLNSNDSTAAARNYTQINSPTATAGKIGGAARLNTTPSAQSLQGPHGLGVPTQYTFSFWAQSPTAPNTTVSQPFRLNSSEAVGYSWGHNTATFRNAFFHRISGGGYTDVKITTSLLANTWYYFCLTWDGANLRSYLNGAVQTTKSATTILGGGNNLTYLSGITNTWNGSIEEFRISNIARSADWIATEYANQNNPSTFYLVEGETPITPLKIKKVTGQTLPEIKAVGGTPKVNIKKIGGINKN